MKTPKRCIFYESSPLRFIPVIYIQPVGGHFGILPFYCPITLTNLELTIPILETRNFNFRKGVWCVFYLICAYLLL